MQRTLNDLANDLEAKTASLNKAASDIAVKAALTIVGDLFYVTPVDTSKALSNWFVTLGSPSNDKRGPLVPGKGGSSQKASAVQGLSEAKAILANKKPGQTIFITNNLPYIRRLNDGYSGQQPAGFVERAVLLGRKTVEKAKLKV